MPVDVALQPFASVALHDLLMESPRLYRQAFTVKPSGGTRGICRLLRFHARRIF